MKWFILLFTFLTSSVWAHPDRYDKDDSAPTFVNLERHRRNYFLTGDPDSKLQVSMKLKTLKEKELYFAYSQVGFWNFIKESSSPFTDINFNPELFYRFRFPDNHFRYFDLGAEHMSNGKEGDKSRSWNKLYVYLPFVKQWGERELEFGLKFYRVMNFVETKMPELRRYQGFTEMQMSLKNMFRHIFEYDELYVNVRPGYYHDGELPYLATEVGLRLKIFERVSAPHLFVQWYNGYGESQLYFNRHENSIRVGFSI